MTFCHLHVHSDHSQLDGLSTPKALAKRASELGMPAIGISDHGTMSGAIDFYAACKAEGIRPILGIELYLAPGGRKEKPEDKKATRYYHLLAFAKDRTGYKNLMKLITEANLTGFYYKGRVDRELLAQYKDGLIVLSGCLNSEVAKRLQAGDADGARESLVWYRDTFGPDFFVELQDHGQDDDVAYLSQVIPLARELDIPMVATGDSHYTLPSEADTAQAMHCMQTGSTLAAPAFGLTPHGAYYLKSPEEMQVLFGHIEGALENSLVIAERCTLELDLDGRLAFPDTSHVTGDDSPLGWLTATCYQALEHRFNALPDDYLTRFQYELQVIEQTGFAEYLILVYDFVKWARDRGIPAVPRGSAAGSLLLYLLGVSDIDPIEYGLTFERFLNPERVQMPDVDMDFADERRAEVFDYLASRYGTDHFSHIATLLTLKARNAIKGSARILGWDSSDAQTIANFIPKLPVNMTIDDSVQQVADLKQLYESDPRVRRLLDLARSVEHKPMAVGVHPAGVVISGDPLTDHVPLQHPPKGDTTIITQYDQKALEKLGLLKMDVLGLSNLTMVERCVKLIREHRGVDVDIRHIADRDAKTFAMLQRGETSTVFQLEGGGMTRYVKELQPEHVRHLAVMVALYRPGPMQLIPAFIARRHGREPVEYLHADLEPILGETYGILVYQDQVLQILEQIAGYTKGQADIVRRAMGKKEADLMASEKAKFLEGAESRGYGAIADELWDEIEPHAGYSFNKAHATCYGMLAYQTAYLKAHYPVEWTAAVLQTSAFKPDELPPLIAEARERAIPLLTPDVNASYVRCSVEPIIHGYTCHGGRGLRYGLGAVKQVGEAAAEAIVREREEHGPYRSMRDLILRVDTRIVTSKILEALAKGGAFDAFGPRESVIATLPTIAKLLTSYKGKLTRRLKSGKSTDDVEFPAVPLVETFTAPLSQYLDWELEALGLFLSDHPFAGMTVKTEPISVAIGLTEAIKAEMDEAKRRGEKYAPRSHTLTAAVVAVKEITTKKKERMAIVSLGDLSGSIEAVVFPKLYKQAPELWRLGSIVRASGKLDVREDVLQLIVDVGASVARGEAGAARAVARTSRKPAGRDDMAVVRTTVARLLDRLPETDDPLERLRRRMKREVAHVAR